MEQEEERELMGIEQSGGEERPPQGPVFWACWVFGSLQKSLLPKGQTVGGS